MVFAFATDERSLMAFASDVEAVANCEGVDVANDGWLFFAVDGRALQPIFNEPAKDHGFVVTNGIYHLEPDDSAPGSGDVLARAASVEGQGLSSVENVKSVLTCRSSGPLRRR